MFQRVHEMKLKCGSFVDFIQYSVFDISLHSKPRFSNLILLGFAEFSFCCYIWICTTWYEDHATDVYICIWQGCRELKFSSAPGFVVFSCVFCWHSCFMILCLFYTHRNELEAECGAVLQNIQPILFKYIVSIVYILKNGASVYSVYCVYCV